MSWVWLIAVVVVGAGLALVAAIGRNEPGSSAAAPSPAAIGEWLAALSSEHPAERADAARRLAPAPEDDASPELYADAERIAPALLSAFEDDDINVRKWATWGIASFVRHEKVPADQGIGILMRALEDEDSTVRTYAAFALEKVGRSGKPAIELLERAKQEDPKRDVRIAAAAASRALRRFK